MADSVAGHTRTSVNPADSRSLVSETLSHIHL